MDAPAGIDTFCAATFMKHTFSRWRGGWRAGWVAILALASVIGTRSNAQGLPGGNIGFNATVAMLFNDIPAFSANVESALTNKQDNTRMTMPMRMLKRDDQFRLEVDLTKIKGSSSIVQSLAAIQNIGMARMASIVSTKNKEMLVMFPELKFYTKVALSEVDVPTGDYKVAKKAGGKETIDGQPCVRQQVTLTSTDGKKTEATTWEATALKNFPIRMLFRPEGSSMAMNFGSVELAAPPADSFAAPKDYKAFDNISSLMQEAMTQVMKRGGK